jgi:hypothetical protein
MTQRIQLINQSKNKMANPLNFNTVEVSYATTTSTVLKLRGLAILFFDLVCELEFVVSF